MNEINMASQAFGLLFLFAAMGYSILLILCGVREVVDGPAPYLDQLANRSVVGVALCLLAWWMIAA